MGKASEPPNQPEPDSYEVLDKETLEHLLNRTLAVSKSKRFLPTREVLWKAYEACYGKDCALSFVKKGMLPNVTREQCLLEIYRKLTGDEISEDGALLEEKQNILRRSAATKPDSIGFTRYLGERPVCVRADAAELSPVGQWHPRKVPPCAVKAPTGKPSGGFASKTVMAGVPMLAKTPWSGLGGVLDVKEEKRNRTPASNKYDTTILNMTANTSIKETPFYSSYQRKTHLSGAPPIDDSERGRAKGYYLYGGTGLHPSPVFASTTPRASDAFKAMKGPNVGGPLKPAHGCALKNPKRRPPADSLEDVAWQALTSSQLSPDKSSSLEQRFVDERMRECEDHSFFVRPPLSTRSTASSPDRHSISMCGRRFSLSPAGPERASNPIPLREADRFARSSSAPPSRPLPGVFGPPEVVKPSMPPDAPELSTCDPWKVKDALENKKGFRPIDLFREMLADGETELKRVDFARGLALKFPEKFGDASKSDVDITFEWFDQDGSGSLDILEVDACRRKWLKISGLKWKEIDGTPEDLWFGEELFSSKLSSALTTKTEFTKEEFDSFNVPVAVRFVHYIEAGGTYYQPDVKRMDPEETSPSGKKLVMSKSERAKMLRGLPRKLAYALRARKLSVDDLFKLIDEDQSGYITKDELSRALAQLDIHAVQYELDELFLHLDPDGSGDVDRREFEGAMRKASKLASGQQAAKGDDDWDDQKRKRQAELHSRLREKQAKGTAVPPLPMQDLGSPSAAADEPLNSGSASARKVKELEAEVARMKAAMELASPRSQAQMQAA